NQNNKEYDSRTWAAPLIDSANRQCTNGTCVRSASGVGTAQGHFIQTHDTGQLPTVKYDAVAQAKASHMPDSVFDIHIRIDRRRRLEHNLVDAGAGQRAVQADHLTCHFGQQHQSIFIAFVPPAHHQGADIARVHQLHRFLHAGQAVDQNRTGAGDITHLDRRWVLAHNSPSTRLRSSLIWDDNPMASSIATWITIPVPGRSSNSPASAIFSRITRLRCSSTTNSTISR